MSTVFVGLSGGVDSAVSAALLKEQGYRVVGCFIKIWQPEFIECSWREDRLDAMRVCAALQIPYKEVDLSEEYKREVVKEMVNNYERGITPNPDVLCNTKIKFGFFAEWAFENGADMIATGHYARIEKKDGARALLRGVDREKDQSYFLWQLSAEQLARTIFPVGGMKKSDVRVLAEKFGVPVARKHDSQGLCFVGDITLPEFLAHYISFKRGEVLNRKGEVVGEHGGAILYTRGQRHGFTHHGDSAPQYVVNIDAEANTITVSPNKNDAACKCVLVTDVRQFSSLENSSVQVRYRERAVRAQTTETSEGMRVAFDVPCIAAPGQSLVWYSGDEVLGGATILKCCV